MGSQVRGLDYDVTFGFYLPIELQVPNLALPGSRVNITVVVRNTYTVTVAARVDAIFNGQYAQFDQPPTLIGPGDTYNFTGSLLMPPLTTLLVATCYYWDGSVWQSDGQDAAVIEIAA
ncbi:MAG: hypothetical protein ACYDHZ_00655 [Dehalococcoidia bacterium]